MKLPNFNFKRISTKKEGPSLLDSVKRKIAAKIEENPAKAALSLGILLVLSFIVMLGIKALYLHVRNIEVNRQLQQTIKYSVVNTQKETVIARKKIHSISTNVENFYMDMAKLSDYVPMSISGSKPLASFGEAGTRIKGDIFYEKLTVRIKKAFSTSMLFLPLVQQAAKDNYGVVTSTMYGRGGNKQNATPELAINITLYGGPAHSRNETETQIIKNRGFNNYVKTIK